MWPVIWSKRKTLAPDHCPLHKPGHTAPSTVLQFGTTSTAQYDLGLTRSLDLSQFRSDELTRELNGCSHVF